MQAFSFFVGWLIIISALWAMTKSKPTRVILYYVLWLLIVLLLVTHGNELSQYLNATGVNNVPLDQSLQQSPQPKQ